MHETVIIRLFIFGPLQPYINISTFYKKLYLARLSFFILVISSEPTTVFVEVKTDIVVLNI